MRGAPDCGLSQLQMCFLGVMAAVGQAALVRALGRQGAYTAGRREGVDPLRDSSLALASPLSAAKTLEHQACGNSQRCRIPDADDELSPRPGIPQRNDLEFQRLLQRARPLARNDRDGEICRDDPARRIDGRDLNAIAHCLAGERRGRCCTAVMMLPATMST